MSERSKHLFRFEANKIAEAAAKEAEYHRKRQAYWSVEYNRSVEKLRQTASIKFTTQQVTGGDRVDLSVDYGDVTAYSRMQEAWNKIREHREAANKFDMDAKTYGSQGYREYELDAQDTLYYRMGGGERED